MRDEIEGVSLENVSIWNDSHARAMIVDDNDRWPSLMRILTR